jgi:hypothetical protein
VCVCVRACVCERERERERLSVVQFDRRGDLDVKSYREDAFIPPFLCAHMK